MLPIIRRTRRPLTDPEVATIVPAPEIRSDFGQFRFDSLASPADNHPSSISPSTQVGQPSSTLISSTSTAPASSASGPSTINNQPSTAVADSAPSTVDHQLSTNPWSLQPNEPATDYQAFVTWLQLSTPRSFQKAADTLQCSAHRLRRIATRHGWHSRANAFDNHRAMATSKALDQLLEDEISDLKQRAERFRLQEWLLHEEMVQAAFIIAQDLKKHPRRTTIRELARLFELASTLGRRAAGLPLDSTTPEPPPLRPNWDAEAALEKIYGNSGTESASASPWGEGRGEGDSDLS